MSRGRVLERDGKVIDRPPLYLYEGAEELVEALMSIGPSQPGFDRDAPISWEAISVWSELTEHHLSPGDYEDLKEMSESYVSGISEFFNKSVPSPYGAPIKTKNQVGRDIANALDFLAARNNRTRQTKGSSLMLRKKPKASKTNA